MAISYESSDRKPVDYVMFAVGFIGYMVFLGGVITTTPSVAVAGILIKLLSILSFDLRRDPAD